MRFEGKVALVTGSSSGIGRAVALRMAGEGADVVINGRDSGRIAAVVKEVQALGRRAMGIRADISSFAESRAMIEQATAEFGKIDILVSNAGVFSQVPFLELSEEAWDRTIDIDLNGAFNCVRNVIGQMAHRGWGRIICVTATAGLTGHPAVAHICAAKTAVHGLAKSLAVEFAPTGVTVNVVAPGLTDTPILGGISEETMALYRRMVPMGRIGKAEELAEACCYLASEEAGYVTGAVLNISGGSYI